MAEWQPWRHAGSSKKLKCQSHSLLCPQRVTVPDCAQVPFGSRSAGDSSVSERGEVTGNLDGTF